MPTARNPIPSRVRGWLLVVAIVTAAETAAVVAILQGVEAPAWVVTAVTAQFAAVPTVAAALSRANLTLDHADRSHNADGDAAA